VSDKYCLQCNRELHNKNSSDLANIAPEDANIYMPCAGCGWTYINRKGECVDTRHQHGDKYKDTIVNKNYDEFLLKHKDIEEAYQRKLTKLFNFSVFLFTSAIVAALLYLFFS